jgi:sensor histidine kinase regulating citrate/malate metabolism
MGRPRYRETDFYIVKQIIQRLGGEIGFADAPGGGTVFLVELPGLQQNDVGAVEETEAA